jgi:hypothetical protein
VEILLKKVMMNDAEIKELTTNANGGKELSMESFMQIKEAILNIQDALCLSEYQALKPILEALFNKLTVKEKAIAYQNLLQEHLKLLEEL